VNLVRSRRSGWPSRAAVIAFGISALAALTLLLAPLGYRTGAFELGTAFTLLRWGAYAGVAGALVSLLTLLLLAVRRDGEPAAFALAAAGLVLGGAMYAYPAWQLSQARSVPPIHDITTDTEEPPPFVALQSARAAAPNKGEYAGEDIARQQREAYPDIRPVTVPLAPDMAFDRALTAANDLGWEVVDADQEAGRIEATDTTLWFGFKDDVVIRIRPVDNGSIVDIRSMSRVGRGDVGTNAKRIRAFVERLTRQD
jgi:uncharacterized protein (DUF1499 family)